MAHSTILKNTGPTTLSKVWYVDGIAVDAGTVNIAATDAHGTVVVASTAATKTGTAASTVYSYVLAIQTQVKVLFVTWTRADTGAVLEDVVEVVGGQLFTLTEARAFDEGALVDTDKYTNAEIRTERDRVTALLEQWTGRSWIPRYCRVELPGTGVDAIDLASSTARTSTGRRLVRPGRHYDIVTIISASAGTTITPTDIESDPPFLYHTTGVWVASASSDRMNVTVEYEYGLAYPEEGVGRIALLLTRDRLVKSPYPDSALSIQTESGAASLVREGGPMANRTRLPEVNAWLKDHSMLKVA